LTSTASLDREPTIEPTERLFVPHRKRLSYSYVINEDGARELRLDYGLKEITFDEEHLFAFGEQLVREPSFTGAIATMWGPGYAWDELRPLLESLLAEGLLRRGDGDGLNDPRGGGLVPSQVPRSVCPFARSWTPADCESITRDLAGRPIEIGYLEAVVPMFRIAHPALDGDDRQVGEANVYPARLRLDRDTEWRVCQYPGSRYRDDTPMNVTALRAMIKHWKPMLATILAVRRELHARLGAPVGPWKIGELYVLSCVILALPTFQLMTAAGAPLHPVLSSLFRITDGIRMTTTDMLFSIEHTRRDDEPMTAAALYEFAEQHTVFIGDTGVCAGPKPMIEEFLAAVVDGAPVQGLDGVELPAEVQRLLAELPAVVDYGLLAAQSWGVALSIFPAMSRCYQAVLAILEPHLAAGHSLIERLRADWRVLTHMQLVRDRDRGVHLNAYRDAYERSWPLCRARIGESKIAKEIAPVAETAMHAVASRRLQAILTTREDLAAEEGVVDGVVAALMLYLREEQAVVAAATRIQEAINQLLDRPRPDRPLSVRDIHANYVMGDAASFPYLFDSLEAGLGLRVECTAHAIAVTDPAAS